MTFRFLAAAMSVACAAYAADSTVISVADAKSGTNVQAKAVAKASPRAATKIGDLAWKNDVDLVDNKILLLEEWAVGDEIALRVENAGETNAVMSVVYTNKVMFSSALSESNVTERANAYTDTKAAEAKSYTDGKLETLAWGNTTSGGAPAPTDTLMIEKKSVSITGGGNYSYVESSTGGYWVLTASTASGWTIESLADAQDETQPSTLTVYDANGNAPWEITSLATMEVYAIAGDEMYAPKVDSSGDNDVITMIFPVKASSHPELMYAPSLSNEFAVASAENWPAYVSTSVWTGESGAYTNVTTLVGKPKQGFFKGKITRAGTTYTKYNKPIGLSQIVIDGTTYSMSVETVNGKKLIVLEAVYE